VLERTWHVVVREDGTFDVGDLPRSTVDVLATCAGWISRGSREIELDGVVRCELEMQAAAGFRATLVDGTGERVANAVPICATTWKSP